MQGGVLEVRGAEKKRLHYPIPPFLTLVYPPSFFLKGLHYKNPSITPKGAAAQSSMRQTTRVNLSRMQADVGVGGVNGVGRGPGIRIRWLLFSCNEISLHRHTPPFGGYGKYKRMLHRIRLQGFKASRLPLTESEGKPCAWKEKRSFPRPSYDAERADADTGG
jgi:hypothetical protein